MSDSERAWQAIDNLADRITDLQAAVETAPAPLLTDDEVRYVKLAIKREAQQIEWRQAVITKTLAGLVWAGFVGLGYVVLDYLKAHGWKA